WARVLSCGGWLERCGGLHARGQLPLTPSAHFHGANAAMNIQVVFAGEVSVVSPGSPAPKVAFSVKFPTTNELPSGETAIATPLSNCDAPPARRAHARVPSGW